MTDVYSHAPTVQREAPWTFESALKDATVEEWVNLQVHRRLAFAVVRQMQGRFESVSPNHLTVLSGALGVCAGICSYRSVEAGPEWLVLGALLLMASAVMDCADGMLARLRGQSSELGRLLDGLVDQVSGISAWYGISHAMCAGIDLPGEWLYCTFALLSVVLHVALYDQIKGSFTALTTAPHGAEPAAANKPAPGRFERWTGALHRNVYGGIMRAFGVEHTTSSNGDRAAARRLLSPAMRKVTYLGLGTQIFVLYTVALLGALTHVWVTFVLGQLLLSVLFNAWTVVSLVSWNRAAARLRAEPAGA
jgi:CDP-diacylglycerol---serine O-phosphatidyltransferase